MYVYIHFWYSPEPPCATITPEDLYYSTTSGTTCTCICPSTLQGSTNTDYFCYYNGTRITGLAVHTHSATQCRGVSVQKRLIVTCIAVAMTLQLGKVARMNS